jgi:hypothetical protein
VAREILVEIIAKILCSRAGGMTEVVEHPLCKRKAHRSNPSPTKKINKIKILCTKIYLFGALFYWMFNYMKPWKVTIYFKQQPKEQLILLSVLIQSYWKRQGQSRLKITSIKSISFVKKIILTYMNPPILPSMFYKETN